MVLLTIENMITYYTTYEQALIILKDYKDCNYTITQED